MQLSAEMQSDTEFILGKVLDTFTEKLGYSIFFNHTEGRRNFSRGLVPILDFPGFPQKWG